MKKILFAGIVLILCFILEYFVFNFSAVQVLDNFRIFGSYSLGEEMFSMIIFLIPIVVLVLIQFLSCFLGKKIFNDWCLKDNILVIVLSIFVSIFSFVCFILLHP